MNDYQDDENYRKREDWSTDYSPRRRRTGCGCLVALALILAFLIAGAAVLGWTMLVGATSQATDRGPTLLKQGIFAATTVQERAVLREPTGPYYDRATTVCQSLESGADPASTVAQELTPGPDAGAEEYLHTSTRAQLLGKGVALQCPSQYPAAAQTLREQFPDVDLEQAQQWVEEKRWEK